MQRFGSKDYPDDWESSCLWNGKISVHLGYPEHGWISLSLLSTAYNGHLVVHCSDVYDPFWNLIDWLKAIAENRLPASLKIDEEGEYKEFIVRPYNGRYLEYADIEFRIIGSFWDDNTKEEKEGCYFLSRAMRVQFLEQFTRRLEQWLREDYDLEGWNSTWREDDPTNPFTNLRNLDIAGLKEIIKSNKNG